VLIVESLDRLSRDQVEQERIVRRLEHRGIIILGVADGYDSRMGGRKIMRGVRGLINELYLDDLRYKTHRGQSGQVGRGYIAGGKSYGYDIVKTESGSKYVINTHRQSGFSLFLISMSPEQVQKKSRLN
jgi:DNA invertase Pin-like site-specific DNA recombinase